MGLNLGLMLGTEGSLEVKRNRLALQARKSGADYLFWLDDDHTFPHDALERLLKRDKAVIGCNCLTRATEPLPTARIDGERLETTAEKVRADLVEEVEGIGFGMVLMRVAIFDALDEWARDNGGERAWPLFDSRTDYEGNVTTGEDMFFCGLLNLAGIPIYVDHALSWEVGHLSQRINAYGEKNDIPATLAPAGVRQGR